MKQPYVSIIIASLNGAAKIGACLDNLKSQTYSQKHYEIIVVNDGSTDDTAKVAASNGAQVISLPYNQGRAAARNAGWLAAKGEIILFTDDDCIASPDWVERLIAQFKPDVVAVGGRIIGMNQKTLGERYLLAMGYGNPAPVAFGASKNPLRRFLAYLSSMFAPAVIQTRPSKAQAIYTANAAYRKEVLKVLRGFDVTLPTSEDTDLAARTRTQYPDQDIVFEPRATVAHAHEPSIWHFARQTYQRARNTLAHYRKEHKFPPIYPFPVLIFALMVVFLIITPWIVIAAIIALPMVFYPWWLIRAVRERNATIILFAYCQCLCETAEVMGLIAGAIRPDKAKTRTV